MNNLLHMIPIKLGSRNYLLRHNKMIPLLSYKKLMDQVNGALVALAATITVDDKQVPNLAYYTWIDLDQKAIILLNSSLTEDVDVEVLSLTLSREIRVALEAAYNNSWNSLTLSGILYDICLKVSHMFLILVAILRL